jgi:hypothetical protein
LWVRHSLPNDDQHDRDTWSWLTGWIISQCGPDEWHVAVDDDRVIEDPAQDRVSACYRDSTELRPKIPGPGQRSGRLAAAPAPHPEHPRYHQRLNASRILLIVGVD